MTDKEYKNYWLNWGLRLGLTFLLMAVVARFFLVQPIIDAIAAK